VAEGKLRYAAHASERRNNKGREARKAAQIFE
jgi:hypothetical protein